MSTATAANANEISRVEPLPIHERTTADLRFTGRGVVAAFLDSGFYAHPDLMTPTPRILGYYDLIGGTCGGPELLNNNADPSCWHGMMSSVVAAGNGSLSGGHFRSLAPDMKLVLMKVGSLSRVKHDDITRGIEWMLINKDRYNIRILNISCGGDYEVSYLQDKLCKSAEDAVRAGIVVVCAVGNRGDRPGYVVPPASSPSVIAVGGVDDAGNPHLGKVGMYRSSYGPTVDGLQKPEVITIADWLAAPLLPGTPTARQAELLHRLAQAPDSELNAIVAENPGVLSSLDEAKERAPYLIRQIVATGLRDGLVINEHYKMVDGTSFAAPIVTSVVAQMLEANPSLTPQQVKRILIQTARRLPNVEVDRQGWGAIQPRLAVEKALELRR
ncbi:MAG: S8 family serine peptidase [Myxococcales bacterium]